MKEQEQSDMMRVNHEKRGMKENGKKRVNKQKREDITGRINEKEMKEEEKRGGNVKTHTKQGKRKIRETEIKRQKRERKIKNKERIKKTHV